MSKNVPGPPAAFSSRALSDAIITNNKRETNWKTCTAAEAISETKSEEGDAFSATSVTTPTHTGGNARTKTLKFSVKIYPPRRNTRTFPANERTGWRRTNSWTCWWRIRGVDGRCFVVVVIVVVVVFFLYSCRARSRLRMETRR